MKQRFEFVFELVCTLIVFYRVSGLNMRIGGFLARASNEKNTRQNIMKKT